MIKKNLIDVQDLIMHYDRNASGIRSLSLIPSHLVEWIDPRKSELLPGDLILKEGLLPIKMDITPDSCTWSEDMGETSHGITYRTNIAFQIPKENLLLRNWIFANKQVRWIAITQDRNFQTRLHGSIQAPLRIGSSTSAGAGRSGRSMRSFGLAGEGIIPAQYLRPVTPEFFSERRFTHEFDTLTFN